MSLRNPGSSQEASKYADVSPTDDVTENVQPDDPAKKGENVAEDFKKGEKVSKESDGDNLSKTEGLESDNTVEETDSKKVELECDSKLIESEKSSDEFKFIEKLEDTEIKTEIHTSKDVSVVEENIEESVSKKVELERDSKLIESEKSEESFVKLETSEKLEDAELNTDARENVSAVAEKESNENVESNVKVECNEGPVLPEQNEGPVLLGQNEGPVLLEQNEGPVLPGQNEGPVIPGQNEEPVLSRQNEGPALPGRRDWKITFAEDAIYYMLELYNCQAPELPALYQYQLPDLNKFTQSMMKWLKYYVAEHKYDMSRKYYKIVIVDEIKENDFLGIVHKLQKECFDDNLIYSHEYFLEFLACLGHFTAMNLNALGADAGTLAIFFLKDTLSHFDDPEQNFVNLTLAELNRWIDLILKFKTRAKLQRAFIRGFEETESHPAVFKWHLPPDERWEDFRRQRNECMSKIEMVNLYRSPKPLTPKKRVSETQDVYADGFKVPISPSKKMASKTQNVQSLTLEKLLASPCKETRTDLLSPTKDRPKSTSPSKRSIDSVLSGNPSQLSPTLCKSHRSSSPCKDTSTDLLSPTAGTSKSKSPSKMSPGSVESKPLFQNSPTLSKSPNISLSQVYGPSRKEKARSENPYSVRVTLYALSYDFVTPNWTIGSEQTISQDFSVKSSPKKDAADWTYSSLLAQRSSENIVPRSPSPSSDANTFQGSSALFIHDTTAEENLAAQITERLLERRASPKPYDKFFQESSESEDNILQESLSLSHDGTIQESCASSTTAVQERPATLSPDGIIVQESSASLSPDDGIIAQESPAAVSPDDGIITQESSASLSPDDGIVRESSASLSPDDGINEQISQTSTDDGITVQENP